MNKEWFTVTNLIILLNIVLFAFANYTNTFYDFVLYTGNPSVIKFFSAAFMHGSIIHLGMNMVFLYYFGPLIENYIGKGLFAVYYAAMIVLSGYILTLINSNTYVVGASGVLYAMMSTLLILAYFKAPHIYINKNALLRLVMINIVFSFAVSGISKSGHIAGLLAGIIGGFVILYYKKHLSR